MIIQIFLKVFKVLRVLSFVNFVLKANLYGSKVKIPVLGGLGLDNLGKQELWLSDLIGIIPKPQDGTFIDVGMNIGQTLIMYKQKYADGSYLGFEPNPTAFFYCTRLIKENHWVNCISASVGISSEVGWHELQQYFHSEIDSGASIIPNFRPDTPVVNRSVVICISESQVPESLLLNAYLIKIDVEGAELDVVKGLAGLIMRARPYIIVEILPTYNCLNAGRIARQNELLSLLCDMNYSILRVKKSNSGHFLGLIVIKQFEVHSDLDACDYFCVSNDYLGQWNNMLIVQ